MIDCPLTLNTDGFWQCPDCKWIYKKKSDKPPHRNCPKRRGQRTEEDVERLTGEIKSLRAKYTHGDVCMWTFYAESEKLEKQLEQAKEVIAAGEKLGWTPAMICCYGRALARWIAAGCPVRSDEEVAAIVATCKACEPHYEAGEGRCKICGCKILSSGMAILSKARMATEHCSLPERKW